jgi:hypothetical protein
VRRDKASTTLRETTEELEDGCAYVVSGEVVDVGLGEHGVVLELRLAERWGVASDDDELGLSGAEGLEGRLVSEGDCEEEEMSVNDLFIHVHDLFEIGGLSHLFRTS